MGELIAIDLLFAVTFNTAIPVRLHEYRNKAVILLTPVGPKLQSAR